MKVNINKSFKFIVYSLTLILILMITPYDIFDGYSCVNDLSDGKLYETLNCRRPVFNYAMVFIFLKIFSSLTPNVIEIIYSLTILILLDKSYNMFSKRAKINFLIYYSIFLYLIILEPPTFSFLFSTLFFIMAFDNLLNEDNLILASVLMFISVNFNFVTLLTIPVMCLIYILQKSNIGVSRRSIRLNLNLNSVKDVFKFVLPVVILTFAISILFPNYLEYTLLYANTFTDRNVLDSNFITTKDIKETSFMQPIIEFFTYTDPDKIHYKNMFFYSIILLVFGEYFYAPIMIFSYLMFGLKDLIWYFATLPLRILLIGSFLTYVSRAINKSDFKILALIILFMILFIDFSYINTKNNEVIDRISNIRTYNIANNFISDFSFDGKVLTDDLLLEQKFYESNGGFLNKIEDSEWCEILVHKYGSIMDYKNCDKARLNEYILPEAKKILEGEYDLIAVSYSISDTQIYASLNLTRNSIRYCAATVPSLHDSCENCRHFMLFLFKEEEKCEAFKKQMTDYYIDNLDTICNDYPHFISEMRNFLYLTGVEFNYQC